MSDSMTFSFAFQRRELQVVLEALQQSKHPLAEDLARRFNQNMRRIEYYLGSASDDERESAKAERMQAKDKQ